MPVRHPRTKKIDIRHHYAHKGLALRRVTDTPLFGMLLEIKDGRFIKYASLQRTENVSELIDETEKGAGIEKGVTSQ